MDYVFNVIIKKDHFPKGFQSVTPGEKSKLCGMWNLFEQHKVKLA